MWNRKKREREETENRGGGETPDHSGNREIEEWIIRIEAEDSRDNYFGLLACLAERMEGQGQVTMPMVDTGHEIERILKDPEKLQPGDRIRLDREVRLRFDTVIDEEGKNWIPLFTSLEELRKQETTNLSMNVSIRQVIRAGCTDPTVEGIVINPFGRSMTLGKRVLQILLSSR